MSKIEDVRAAVADGLAARYFDYFIGRSYLIAIVVIEAPSRRTASYGASTDFLLESLLPLHRSKGYRP